MKHILVLLFLALLQISCHAKEPVNSEPANPSRWNQLMEKAMRVAGAIKEYGEPRRVKRGATPELILKADEIYFNLKPLHIGGDVSKWIDVLGKKYRISPYGTSLIWDEHGVSLVTDEADKKTVVQINIYLNKRPKDPLDGLVTHRPDGTPVEPTYNYWPSHPFSGYLELDSVGIDAKTKFWEIAKYVDQNRNLRCGLRDCLHPHGNFSPIANISMRLNSKDEYGEIYELIIGGYAEELRKLNKENKAP